MWLVSRQPEHRDGRAPAQIIGAADLALQVERSCGEPQDVEWAWDGERLWLVQARPITTTAVDRVDACETPVDGCELTTNGIGEMLPGVLPPLVWDIGSDLVEEALRNVLGELRGLPPLRHAGHEFVRRVHGRAALNLDLLTAAARTMPGGSESEIERQYFGAATETPRERTGGWRLALQGLRAAALARASICWGTCWSRTEPVPIHASPMLNGART